MWLEKLVLVYLLTLFNSLDGYFLDNHHLQSNGRHRRKDSNEAKAAHRNSLGPLQSQFITKNNTRVISQRGGLAVLPCSVTMTTPATVSWFRRKDYQLLTVGLSTYSSDDRFLVEHTRHLGNWALRIKNARKEDEGLYECQISTHPPQSIFIELRIVEAVAEILEAPDLHIDEGSTLRLECKLKRATESPLYVFWYHEDRMVNYDQEDGVSVSNNKLTSSILTVRNATARHGGNYTCAPANARQSSVYVHVLKGEKPAAMQHPNKSPTATSGASATSLTAYRCGWLRPTVHGPGASTYGLLLASLLPATISLITSLTCWSVASPSSPSRPATGHKRRRHEPYHVATRPGRSAPHCILTVLLHFVKTIFSKSIKLFDVV
ncbi:Fc receptor-like protein 5 [Anopheles stephensi]|uniref:Fc receptor-like protein 5 n=1 Tax=Anopheles stephensi TaxID=30069 RepID=UPI001658AC22|nr:Fc receptor-like protein 5 [Anopheles stephensi]XP_035917189.1 Fc receptor-like protein 5 [Anopheles stephensi]XP_035917190.1 Fc receptor-like protein 5 [Anopheles stephensi]XP_035917191.1 Fc receptor-like protein 5 [Anopheles stephensi]XP_035917192.1 Fc receptor-like protein 5 [Anopheles stephensi]